MKIRRTISRSPAYYGKQTEEVGGYLISISKEDKTKSWAEAYALPWVTNVLANPIGSRHNRNGLLGITDYSLSEFFC